MFNTSLRTRTATSSGRGNATAASRDQRDPHSSIKSLKDVELGEFHEVINLPQKAFHENNMKNSEFGSQNGKTLWIDSEDRDSQEY